ncbi:zinc finger protein ZAT12-like [Papaver somniferum]|uniref:zinc finger protein ZAT12-like n=1 Tax=Papaver somniferum TaxID=3469 RepID=UPI000E703746|nr:zinc finger protein ZAT12-like [Papaver somniferum]
MSNKRSRGDMEDISIANMVKFLMLLSRNQGDHVDYQSSRVFECKTCNRQFPSFQALGGRRARHKKPKLMDPTTLDDQSNSSNQQQAVKPKIHECSICGLQFSIGQALGGHIRRQRAAMLESSFTTAAGFSSSSSDVTTDDTTPKQVPVFKRSNSSRRTLGLNLDLKITKSVWDVSFMHA